VFIGWSTDYEEFEVLLIRMTNQGRKVYSPFVVIIGDIEVAEEY